ncbi:hypothetical protein D3C78_1698590 [compost metagenome]
MSGVGGVRVRIHGHVGGIDRPGEVDRRAIVSRRVLGSQAWVETARLGHRVERKAEGAVSVPRPCRGGHVRHGRPLGTNGPVRRDDRRDHRVFEVGDVQRRQPRTTHE